MALEPMHIHGNSADTMTISRKDGVSDTTGIAVKGKYHLFG
ncbi:hypothetical protein [Paenibacillus sp. Z6-24]